MLRILRTALLVLCVTACGCQEQILHDLSESEANRIVSRLHSAELSAEKVVQSDGRWAISLPERQASKGLRYLEEHRVVSSQRSDTFAFAKGGLIPSREEQRFRYERALAAAIEESLQAVKGVLEARVHLNLPPSEGFAAQRGEKTPGSSAVLLLVDERFNTQDSDVARLVAGAAGLQVERISVLRSVTGSVVLQNVTAELATQAPLVPVHDEPRSEVLHGSSYRAEYSAIALGIVGIVFVVIMMRRRAPVEVSLPWRKVHVVEPEE